MIGHGRRRGPPNRATSAAIDGRFTSGPLQGCTVNVKWYLKREGTIDVTESDILDYYLVLAGPAASVKAAQWTAAEIFPEQHNHTLIVQPEQRALLQQFAPAE